MRKKKLCRPYIRPWRVEGPLLLDIGFCKNPRILWRNVSFWFNVFIGLWNFRDTWKYRKNNQNYKDCLNTFNDALKNKLQHWNTEAIPYLKAIKQKCARCKWPKRKNFSQANCVRNCEGRFKINFRHVSGLIYSEYNILYIGKSFARAFNFKPDQPRKKNSYSFVWWRKRIWRLQISKQKQLLLILAEVFLISVHRTLWEECLKRPPREAPTDV